MIDPVQRRTLWAVPILLLASFVCRAAAQEVSRSVDSVAILREQGRQAARNSSSDSVGYAIARWLHAASLAKQRGTGETGVLLANVGNAHWKLHHADSAFSYLHLALAILHAAGDRQNEARVLASIALVHEDLRQSDSALVDLRAALAYQREAGDSTGQGKTLSALGSVLSDLGQVDSGHADLHAALAIQRNHGDRADADTTLMNIATLHAIMGQADSALVELDEAVVSMRELGDGTGAARALYGIGRIRAGRGEIDSALAAYRAALAIQADLRDGAGEAFTLTGMGAVFRHLGQFDSALVAYRAALAIEADLKLSATEAVTLGNIGDVRGELGELDSALVAYRAALAILRDLKVHVAMGEMLQRMGSLYRARHELDSALASYRAALTIRRDIRDRQGEGVSLNSIGCALHDLGKPDSALAYWRAALAISSEVRDSSSKGNTLLHIAILHGERLEFDSALADFRTALAIARALRDPSTESVVLSFIGMTYQGLDDLGRAVAYYDSAAAVFATVARHTGADVDRLSFAEAPVDVFGFWVRTWLARAGEVGWRRSALAALGASEHGRAQALLDLMRGSAPTSSPGADLEGEGARLLGDITRAGAAALVYVVTRDRLLVWFALPSSPDSEFAFAQPEVAVTRDSLARLVQGFRAGLGVDEPTARSRIALREGPGLEAAPAARSVPVATKTSPQATAAAGRALASLLLPPDLAQRLEPGRELVIVPQGPLASLPFAALSDDTDRGPLGLRYALRYAPSLATLEEAEHRRGLPSTAAERLTALRSALVVGVSDFQPPLVTAPNGDRLFLPPLPAAAVESRWVAERFGTTPLLDTAATEEAVRRRLPAAPLVHFATHGYAFTAEAQARNSFLALTPSSHEDGLLTVGEVLDDPSLTLTAELVTLSACQTGLGDLKQAEGTVGLQRAFLARGARSLLVSLWSVSDTATAALMRGFYNHWLGDGDHPSKAEALRRAQADVRRMPGFAEPKYWAAFELVGAR